MPSTGFSLGEIHYTCLPLGLRVAELNSFQVFSLALSIRWFWETVLAVRGLWFSNAAWVEADQSPQKANLTWGPKSGTLILLGSLVRLHNWLGSADEQTTGWYYYLSSAHRKLVFQDLSAGCYKPLSLSPSQSDSQWFEPSRFPCNLCGMKME